MSRKRTSGARAPNGASSIYLGGDGRWHGRVTVGVKDDGSPDRRHVQRRTESEVIAAVRALEREREAGTVRKAGRAMTVEAWLTHWLENIARPSIKYKSYRAYRTAVEQHLVPGLGKHRLDKVGPEHLEKLYARMITNGARPAYAHQVHRTARTAFGEAHRRGHVVRNPVALAKARASRKTRSSPSRSSRFSGSSRRPSPGATVCGSCSRWRSAPDRARRSA